MTGYHPLLVNDEAFADFVEPFPELDMASRVIRTAIAVVLTLRNGIVDLISSAKFTFSLFHLVPVGILAWVQGAEGAVSDVVCEFSRAAPGHERVEHSRRNFRFVWDPILPDR